MVKIGDSKDNGNCSEYNTDKFSKMERASLTCLTTSFRQYVIGIFKEKRIFEEIILEKFFKFGTSFESIDLNTRNVENIHPRF